MAAAVGMSLLTSKGNAAGRHEVVLITAHLDSINLQGGPTAPAPGADDNGSGSAGLLEIARAFADHRSEHDLRFILFRGEEECLFGSQQYVAKLSASEKRRIRAVVNMDMIGSLNTSTRSVMLEGAPLSQQVMNGLGRGGGDLHTTHCRSLSSIDSPAIMSLSLTRESKPYLLLKVLTTPIVIFTQVEKISIASTMILR